MAIKETKGDFDFAPIQKNARQIRAGIVRQAKSKPAPPQPIVNTIFEQAIARARAAKARAALLDYKYVNRDTGRVYAPHTDAERDLLVSDTPRYLLIRGGEGCFSGDTIVEGVPIAELPQGLVKTVAGYSESSAGYLKGKADLYRVRTESGSVVEVTLAHRFLTPTGFRPLSHLRVGDVVAADGTERDNFDLGKAKGFRDYCYSYSRPCGELSTPLELVFRDKVLRPFLRDIDHLHTLCRACTDNSFYPSERIQQQTEFLSHALSGDDGFFQLEHGSQAQSHRTSPLPYTDLQSHPLGEEFYLFLLACGYYSHRQESGLRIHEQSQESRRFLSGFSLNDTSHTLDGVQSFFDELPALSESHFDLGNLQRQTGKIPSDAPSQSDSLSLRKSAEVLEHQWFSCPKDNTYWTEIQDISFSKHAEYYDLHVPFWNHYSAHGLYHHNSGKSVFGTIKDIGKLRRGMNMVIGSPDFIHFSKSLFPEFIRWCPPEIVVEKDQYRLSPTWEPQKQFTMHFHTIYGGISVAYMGGFDEPASWEGANVSAAHFDEARRHKTPAMIKVLDGRVRIAGAAGEPPQFYLTTTPAKHWLYDYFGNIECKCDVCETEFSDTTALTKEQFMMQKCPVCGA